MRWVYLHGDKVTKGSDGLLMPHSSFLGIPLDSEVPKFFVFLLLTFLVIKATSNLMKSKIFHLKKQKNTLNGKWVIKIALILQL